MAELDDEVVEVNGGKIAVDDFIQVHATTGKPRFIGKIKGWWIKDGEVVTIDVWGGSKGHEQMRSVRLDQVTVLSTRKQNQLQRTKVEPPDPDDVLPPAKKTAGKITLRKGKS
jgi:hypothetical protein